MRLIRLFGCLVFAIMASGAWAQNQPQSDIGGVAPPGVFPFASNTNLPSPNGDVGPGDLPSNDVLSDAFGAADAPASVAPNMMGDFIASIAPSGGRQQSPFRAIVPLIDEVRKASQALAASSDRKKQTLNYNKAVGALDRCVRLTRVLVGETRKLKADRLSQTDRLQYDRLVSELVPYVASLETCSRSMNRFRRAFYGRAV